MAAVYFAFSKVTTIRPCASIYCIHFSMRIASLQFNVDPSIKCYDFQNKLQSYSKNSLFQEQLLLKKSTKNSISLKEFQVFICIVKVIQVTTQLTKKLTEIHQHKIQKQFRFFIFRQKFYLRKNALCQDNIKKR